MATMVDQMQELAMRVAALENERARNITALVEQGVEFERRVEALERARPPMTAQDAYTELHNRSPSKGKQHEKCSNRAGGSAYVRVRSVGRRRL